ncbi:hypothetical protein QE382_003225 [Sphingobacterium zeae]|uniref:RNA-binding protein n=1 Tax=Sphingobacterium zeae TaxID=1776859 RepID=A0ABU0U946_9SPHI|nr:hypothetical protein [Sphingobacterium zeae]
MCEVRATLINEEDVAIRVNLHKLNNIFINYIRYVDGLKDLRTDV